LSLACTNANAALVARLLEAGADPHRAPSGEPPILTCARSGNPAAVAALLDGGASVDARETWRCQTPLMWAAAEDHAEVVKLLLVRGADVDTATEEGRFTALTFAARQGALESARLLIDEGADVDARAATTGETLLQVAIKNRHYAIASLLLRRGANPRAADKGGRTALHALVTARAPVSRERAPGVEDSSDGLDLMRALLAAGADPDAMTAGLPKLADALVPSAIRPIIDNAVNTGGATPLLLAAQAADFEAMRVLLAGGADPLATTYGGTTALMLAAGLVFVEGSQRFRSESDALEAVRLALEAGTDVNAINEHGQTALHGAVYRAANTVIEALIGAGARTDLADERGRTPLALAEQGFNQVASVIRRERAAELLRRLESQRLAGPTREARVP
jgi:ankyrin repeat protein